MNWNVEGWEIVQEDGSWLPSCTILEQVSADGLIRFYGWIKEVGGTDDFTVAIWRKKAPKICGDNCGCKDVTECDLSNVLTPAQ